MISMDTNLLLHSYNVDSPRRESAYNWMSSLQSIEDVAIMIAKTWRKLLATL